MAGGSVVRSQTRPTKTRSPAGAELLGHLVIELLPALLDIQADGIDTRTLVTPVRPG
jgi:hypothetical protein